MPGTTVRSALAQAAVFSLPALHVAGLERSAPATTIELIAADGLVLTPQSVSNLSPEELGSPRDRLAYNVRRDDYSGRFVVAPGQRQPVRLITFVELTDRQLSFRSRIEPTANNAGLRSLEVRLRGWPGSSARLDAPDARVLSEVRGQGTYSLRAWNIRNERSAPRKVELTGSESLEEIAARAADGTHSGLLLPDVQLSGVECVESWVILDAAAARFRLETAGAKLMGQSPIPETAAVLRAGGRAWRRDADDGPAMLVEAERAEAAVRVTAREHSAAVLDQRRWSYQSAWWLFHDGPAELLLTLPAGAKLASVTLFARPDEGIEQPLPRAGGAELRVQLRGAGASRLVVRWLGAESKGALPPPDLEMARLNVDADGTGVRVLTVPPGYRAASEGSLNSGPLSAARAELERAAGQQRLARLLLESLPVRRVPEPEGPSRESQIVACQQRLARHLWSADQILKASPIAPAFEKEYTESIERLQDLREQQRDLLRSHDREMPKLENGDATSLGGIGMEDQARSGKVYSQVDAGSATRIAQPVSALIVEESLALRQSLGGTILLGCFVVVVWVLATFPPAVKLARVFWPEQAVLLGLAGLRIFGPTWMVVFLLALGVVARVLLLGAALRAFALRWRRTHSLRA